MPVRQLSDGNSDGNVLGQSASDLISFYNASPIAQRSGAAQAAIPTTAPTNTSPYGYSQAQATVIITLLNEIRATLVGLERRHPPMDVPEGRGSPFRSPR